jgi:hypothetical protein
MEYTRFQQRFEGEVFTRDYIITALLDCFPEGIHKWKPHNLTLPDRDWYNHLVKFQGLINVLVKDNPIRTQRSEIEGSNPNIILESNNYLILQGINPQNVSREQILEGLIPKELIKKIPGETRSSYLERKLRTLAITDFQLEIREIIPSMYSFGQITRTTTWGYLDDDQWLLTSRN